jgi:hypothetical protein
LRPASRRVFAPIDQEVISPASTKARPCFRNTPLQEIAILAFEKSRLMNLQFRVGEAHAFDEVIQMVGQRVVDPTKRTQPAEQIGERIKGGRREAACRCKVAVFNKQDAAGLKDVTHLEQARDWVRRVKQ